MHASIDIESIQLRRLDPKVDGYSSIPYDYGMATKNYWEFVAPAIEDGEQALGGYLLLCITAYDLYGFVYEIPQHASIVS